MGKVGLSLILTSVIGLGGFIGVENFKSYINNKNQESTREEIKQLLDSYGDITVDAFNSNDSDLLKDYVTEEYILDKKQNINWNSNLSNDNKKIYKRIKISLDSDGSEGFKIIDKKTVSARVTTDSYFKLMNTERIYSIKSTTGSMEFKKDAKDGQYKINREYNVEHADKQLTNLSDKDF